MSNQTEDQKARPRRKRRRKSGLIEILNGALSLLVLGIIVVVGLAFYGLHLFNAPRPELAERTVLIERGAGLSTIAQQLADDGVIGNRWVFQAGAVALKKQAAIKAGEYRIAAGASMADVLHEITEGRPILLGVTIPEGLTSWQAVERLKADENLTGDIEVVPAEGSILPDTYNYERGASRQAVLDQMLAARDKVLAGIWEGRSPDLPLKSVEELVTLASIVEKETGVASERPEVAAVFVNRLKKGMRLQSDPTIIYGITNGQGPLGRGLKKSEIEAKTPYNTYQIDGLPAGPIANPGIEALRATANPAASNALYFVAKTADPADGHVFAATYAEHQKNVVAYRKALAAAEQEAEAAREVLEADEAGKADTPAKGQ